MITLYGLQVSSRSRKVQWALEEAGASYSYVTIDIRKGESRTPEFLARNPSGTIPTLSHDDYCVWEANAILLYVAEVVGDGLLQAQTPRDRGAVQQWLFWEASSLGEPLHAAWLVHYRIGLGMPADPEALANAIEAAKRPLGLLDHHLTDRSFMVGDRFGLADIGLAASVAQCRAAGIDLEPYAHVRAWLERLAVRLAFQRVHPDFGD